MNFKTSSLELNVLNP